MGTDIWQQEFPFESRFIDQKGVRQHYVDEGQGEPILMVHGNPTWSFYYRHLMAAFRESHRVIAVDHVGCGLSDKPQKYRYRLHQHLDNLKHLVNELKLENATLVVHDWGGPIGLGMYLHLTHRFKRVVLLNTGAFLPEKLPFGLQVARWPLVGKLAIRGFNLFCKKALTTAVADPAALSDIARQGLLAPYNNWANRVAIHQFVQDIPTRRAHPSYGALKLVQDGLVKLEDVPVKMIWGMKDWVFTGEVLAEMEKRIPHASVHRIENAGHYVMEEAREEVIEQIGSFLQ
ncbi:MAG: alpha/beta fold hydrolase [Planctomycetota bacterium]|nr:alpha/beta fold hydrolase [Planctomycetota bacterium]